MKYWLLALLALPLFSCEEETLIFDQPANERVEEAVAELKAELVAPENGWRLQYRPNNESGSYFVLLNFDQDGKVTIMTDLSSNDGEFFEQTIPYRVDNSLGLELIFETYSFFSFLFELDQTEFGGEFEFDFVNKTPDNALVFASKSDNTIPTTRITLIPAEQNDRLLLGRSLSQNLNIFQTGSRLFNPPYQLVFQNQDLAFQFKMNYISRTIDFNYVSQKSNLNNGQTLDISEGFLIQGDSLILNDPISGTFNGINYEFDVLELENLQETSLALCNGNAEESHIFTGSINGGLPVTLERSLFDVRARDVLGVRTFYLADVTGFFPFIVNENDSTVAPRIRADLQGAQDMQLYFIENNPENPFYAAGFRIQNSDESNTFFLKRFAAEFEGNLVKFNFADTVSVFGNQNYQANPANMDFYLDKLSAGDQTRVYQINENFYEFLNPCTGWRFIFQAN